MEKGKQQSQQEKEANKSLNEGVRVYRTDGISTQANVGEKRTPVERGQLPQPTDED